MQSPLLTGRDIVIVGQQAWDVEIGSNCKNIALELARHNRVLYVNPPLDRASRWLHRRDVAVQKRVAILRKKKPALICIKGNLWNLYPDRLIESINWMPDGWLFDALNKRNNRLVAASINHAVAVLHFWDLILFNDNDIIRCFYLKQLLRPSGSIYYSRDYMLGVDYWKKHGSRLEPLLIAASDLCMANSTYLASYCGRYNPHSFYVGQGCETEQFVTHSPIPKDMETFHGPVIGYVGALQHIRLDLAAIEQIAFARPEWQVVLVGPEDEVFAASTLHNIPNIHFLGPKPPTELPGYVHAFDVCLNPQILNAVTIGNYPRKIDEYLAAGKPVVATRTEAMDAFADWVYLAGSAGEYPDLIEQAIRENSADKQEGRRAFARGHTWEKSVSEIVKHINF